MRVEIFVEIFMHGEIVVEVCVCVCEVVVLKLECVCVFKIVVEICATELLLTCVGGCVMKLRLQRVC